MQTEDLLKVWSSPLFNQGGVNLTVDLDDVPFTGSAVKIIDGRVSVHSVLVSHSLSRGLVNRDNYQNSRAFMLGSSSTISDVAYKFIGMWIGGLRNSSTSSLLPGGNGILFEDGVYLARDEGPPNGGSVSDVKKTALGITIFYTGGANT